MSDIHGLNRLLFSGALGWIETPDGYAVDGSSLGFIMEELVALSAVEVLIPSHHPAAIFVDSLDARIASRIRVLDTRSTLRTFQALMAPITDEYAVEYDGSLASNATINLAIHSDLAILYTSVDGYLMAMLNKTEIDLNISNLRRALGNLRAVSRSPGSRAVLANLEGIFNTYTPVQAPALMFKSSGQGALIDSFNDLLGDALYQQAAQEAHGFGVPSRLGRAVTLTGRALRRLAKHARFSHLLDFGATSIAAATGVPVLGSGKVAELITSDYLPPIVSVSHSVERGKKAWQQADTMPILFENVKGRLGSRRLGAAEQRAATGGCAAAKLALGVRGIVPQGIEA